MPWRGPGSGWSARSTGAPGRARANELDAGERRPMIGSEEEPLLVMGLLGFGVGGLASRCAWLAGVVSHAPIRHLPGGGCHDRDIRGAGLLSQVIERG